MSKPAVLHIITRLDLGGAQKSVLALMQELQQNYSDFEVYLITGTTGELITQAQQLNNVYLLDTLVWEIKPTNLILEFRNFGKLIKIMRLLKVKHDKIIVHTHTIKAGTLGRWAAFLAGVKIRIHTIHGFAFHLYQNKLIWLIFYLVELFNNLITSHFICVSSQDLSAGSEIFPGFAKKASIIRAATTDFALDCKLRTRLRRHLSLIGTHDERAISKPSNQEQTVSEVKIGTIANLKPGKNLFELLKAFKFAQKQLKKHLILLKLEIIGDGPLRPAIQAYLKQHNLNNSVVITGWTANPLIYAQKWQGFIFTSLWEGLPCALVEIQALNIPIFAYQVGGLADLIDQSRLIYPGKWLDLAQALIQFQLNPTKQAIVKPKLDFYIPKMAADHVSLYKKLLEKSIFSLNIQKLS